jgi:hypothetical protein
LIAVPLPTIKLDFVLNDGDVSLAAFDNLEEELEEFFFDVLSTNSAIKNFESVYLIVDIEQYDVARKRNRHLATGVSMTVEGTAYVMKEKEGGDDESTPPSSEDLSKILRAYFSFWGGDDLVDHFQSGGLKAQNLQVSIDNSLVEVVTDENEDLNNGDQDSNGVKSSNPSDEDAGLAPGWIAGVVLCAAAFILIIGFMVFRGSIDRQSHPSRRDTDHHNNTDTSAGRIGASPYPVELATPTTGGDFLDENDEISIDHSLYTTDEAYVPPTRTVSTKSYDATRLDKVIALAKQRSDPSSASHE